MHSEEDKILWNLTRDCYEVEDEIKRYLDILGWLDMICAKAQFGYWIDGYLPTEFSKFNQEIEDFYANLDGP